MTVPTMDRQASQDRSVADDITAARLQEINEELDNIYSLVNSGELTVTYLTLGTGEDAIDNIVDAKY